MASLDYNALGKDEDVPIEMGSGIPPASGCTPGTQQGRALRARRARPTKPNYNHIHRFPLPISVHPLPPFIPHNPLSVISVLLSYITYFISPPRRVIYAAYFDSDTSSVHVTDEKAIRALWEMGFFGKGSLSRSEPSWLEREKRRRGLLGSNTSEDITIARRSERRELKLERARAEKKAIEERLKAEAAARADSIEAGGQQSLIDGKANDVTPPAERFSLRRARQAKGSESEYPAAQDVDSLLAPAPALEKRASNGKTVRFSPFIQEKKFTTESSDLHLSDGMFDEASNNRLLKNQEHLQLSNEEAFFLVYGLGAIEIFDKHDMVIPPSTLLTLFRRHSYFPPRDPSDGLEPDDPFIVSFAVYYHFRSLGWVVRSGVKFGADYLLYNRGPAFSHAEFAVLVLPSYSHPHWQMKRRRERAIGDESHNWWWLHCVNRIQAQVKKALVVCYVEIPPPDSQCNSETDIGGLLSQYKIREINFRRWVPNRMRD